MIGMGRFSVRAFIVEYSEFDSRKNEVMELYLDSDCAQRRKTIPFVISFALSKG